MASQSCKISIIDLAPSAALLSSLAAEFPAAIFSSHTCDISDWDSQAAAFADVYSKSGGIDIVFANAGITEAGQFLEKSEGEPTKPEMKTLDVDLVGTLYSEYGTVEGRDGLICGSDQISSALYAQEYRKS